MAALLACRTHLFAAWTTSFYGLDLTFLHPRHARPLPAHGACRVVCMSGLARSAVRCLQGPCTVLSALGVQQHGRSNSVAKSTRKHSSVIGNTCSMDARRCFVVLHAHVRHACMLAYIPHERYQPQPAHVKCTMQLPAVAILVGMCLGCSIQTLVVTCHMHAWRIDGIPCGHAAHQLSPSMLPTAMHTWHMEHVVA